MPSPSPEEQVRLHGQYAKELSALVRPGGHLVSVERYEEDSAYAGLVRALELAGFCQVKGTHMQFSCRTMPQRNSAILLTNPKHNRHLTQTIEYANVKL